ncbi:uncharacterized protein Z518_04465 [Rhinocladiella mackenziei CBS 650.93]|uniref:3-hydroxybutyryl-CoA dehydrogenase n=1 Tax=Rhinocladiella mackenziei CBS 650.93 TaxID=1442369 RepID=A0A0D2ILB8_9EURO|nr:uncharacterized protein Z518_04465 [Rhinocladiella mackenziei CBS 650.93]KIX06489.1 hypothetical protein Z518_04465 [Rhinocladiella mackenziei CBS 650.93]
MAIPLAGKVVALLGAGSQGRRLAYMVSAVKPNTLPISTNVETQLRESEKFIEKLRSGPQRSGVTPGKIKTYTLDMLRVELEETWLIVDCVPEKVELKRRVITQLDEVAPEDTIIASNSSSYTISEMIRSLSLSNERRILNAHSYWPPETPEIMGHGRTEPASISLLIQQCREHGFSPFHVKQDSMGYIYKQSRTSTHEDRIWAAIKREALLTAAEGVATPTEIDEIFKDVLKTDKGPFEQMDVVGLDVVLNIEEHYAAKRSDIPSETRQYLQHLINDGRLGVKGGRGFYDYGGLLSGKPRYR